MPDDAQTHLSASSGAGQSYGEDRTRAVHLYDLENFSLRIENQLANISRELAEAAKRHDAYELKVDTNSKEVDKLREHYHDLAGTMTVLNAKTSALEPRLVVELIRLIPVMQHLERIAEKREMQDVLTGDELSWVRAERVLQEGRVKRAEQLLIGRLMQVYIIPGAVVIFIIDQILTQLAHWHP